MKKKNRFRIFTSIVQMLFLGFSLMAQDSQNLNSVGEWKKIELKQLSFCAPKELMQKEVRCIDSGCYEFENNEFNLGIDITVDAFRPTYERKFPSYSEENIWLDENDGVSAWMWSYERDTGKQKYHAGALFKFRQRPNYLVNMTFRSNDTNVKDIASKIIKSVKFTKTKE